MVRRSSTDTTETMLRPVKAWIYACKLTMEFTLLRRTDYGNLVVHASEPTSQVAKAVWERAKVTEHIVIQKLWLNRVAARFYGAIDHISQWIIQGDGKAMTYYGKLFITGGSVEWSQVVRLCACFCWAI